MKTTRSILMLFVAAAAFSACDKNEIDIAAPPEGGAAVRFFNFSVGSPGVNFYVNDVKATGISTTACFNLGTVSDSIKNLCLSQGIESTSGVAYGSAGNGANAWYMDIAPGTHKIQGRIAGTVDPNLPIAELQANVAQGKYYSFYLSGAYNTTTKSTDSFIVEDDMPAVDFTVAYVRFVNASGNSSPMTLYAKDRVTLLEVPVGGEVAYKSAGAFTALPPASYDLAARVAGSATNTFSRTPVAFAAGRTYTITARGTVPVTCSASVICLDNTANR